MCWKPTQRCWRLPLGGSAQPPPAARATGPSHLPPWAMGALTQKPRWLTHVGMKLRSLWSRWNRLYSTEYTQSPLPMRPGTDCTEATPPSALSPLQPDHPAPSPSRPQSRFLTAYTLLPLEGAGATGPSHPAASGSPTLSFISGPLALKSDKTFPPKCEIQTRLESST